MYFEQFTLGTKINLEPVTIKKERMIDFAKEYDNIPLHTDEKYAQTTIFGDLIAPGVMTFMSVWSKFLELNLAADEFIAGKSTKIEWEKPVYANDTLRGVCTVSRLTKRNKKNGIVEISVDVYNQNGIIVLKNVTEMIVKCEPKV
jgi:acyl dehydratase